MAELFSPALLFVVILSGGALARRLGQSAIPFYMVLGLALGPYGLEIVRDSEVVGFLAELGMIFLLLFLGLEFSLKRLQAASTSLFFAGGIDLGINFSLGLLAGIAMGFSLAESFLLAGIVYMSSSGIVTKALIDLKKLANPETESILGVMVFEDLFIVFFFLLFSGAVMAGEVSALSTLSTLGGALVFFLAFVVVAKRFSNAVKKLFQVKSEELFVLLLFASVLTVSAVAQEIGISAAIGGFLLGLLLSEVESQTLKKDIALFKDLFAAVFFFYSGMLINLSSIPEALVLALLSLPLFIVAKVFTGYLLGRIQGISSKRSLFVGFGIVPRGEFSLILANFALLAGLSSMLYSFAALLVLVTSIVGVLLMEKSDAIYGFFKRS